MARRSPFTALLSLVVVAVQLGSAYVVLGAPDLAAARDFLTGTGSPTMAGSLAAAQLVLWGTLGVALIAALVASLTGAMGAVGAVQSASRNAIWSVAVVAVGALILAAGVDHRTSAGSVTLSGGSLQEARAQLSR